MTSGDEKSRLKDRRTRRSFSRQGQLCARALNTSAFLACLSGDRIVEMQRQEENKQQDRRAHKALELVRFPGYEMKHVKNLAQKLL